MWHNPEVHYRRNWGNTLPMSKRRLTMIEIEQAQLVFASSLETERVVLHEEITWPNRIANFGATLHGNNPPSHNAITLANHIYFPIKLSTDPTINAEVALKHMAWLIHELTHSWQYQMRGIGYFFRALGVQIRLGPQAYAYGWESGLEQALARGATFSDFNPEQQGEITRHYYYRLKRGLDISAWRPWIQAIHASA